MERQLYKYTTEGTQDLFFDLLYHDNFTMRDIASELNLSRQLLYRWKKGEYLPKREYFDKMISLRSVDPNDSILLQYYIDRLKQYNPVRETPQTKQGIKQWFMALNYVHKRLQKTDIDTKRIINFALSSYCPITIESPVRLKFKIADVVEYYRKHAATSSPKGRNKMQIATDVARGFSNDFPNFSRKPHTIKTNDSILAHTVDRMGGLRMISMMDQQQFIEQFKFTYLELMKHPPVNKKSLIKHGNEEVIILKDYR